MSQQFFKYQSLGNDFIIFDWLQKTPEEANAITQAFSWKDTVIALSDRHYGIGADGVLVVTHCLTMGVPEILIFNADGGNGQNCLNGLRCVAKHLFDYHRFPQNFRVKMAGRLIECIIDNKVIKTNVGLVNYQGIKAISTSVGDFTGYCVTVGNPHFIIFAPQFIEWLQQNGGFIESHEEFPFRTNVEFIELAEDGSYNVLVYERGCGVTLACGSGAAAIIGLLENLGSLHVNQHITLNMPGGKITGYVNHDKNIVLSAGALYVFSGVV